jgi:hypothetical protein
MRSTSIIGLAILLTIAALALSAALYIVTLALDINVPAFLISTLSLVIVAPTILYFQLRRR